MNNFALARKILGDDFISPEQLATSHGLNYTNEQVAELESTLPDRETLEWLKLNNHYLVTGPPRDMSILDIRKLAPNYVKVGSREAFTRKRYVSCRWYMLRKGIVPNSTSKTWYEGQSLLSRFEITPMAVELVWGLSCYKAVKGVFLLDSFIRASDALPYGNRVVILCGKRLSISACHDHFPHETIGIASERFLL